MYNLYSKERRISKMSHRIEYLTIDGGTVIEFTDDKGYARLANEADMGYIVITNYSRY
jgi:hypothetical protein